MSQHSKNTETSDQPYCPLCSKRSDMVMENELAYALYDTNPVSSGHCLVVTNRHVAEYFDATPEEKVAIWDLVDKMKVMIDDEYHPDGYNIGVNIGKSAGQSVPHIHIHMIPRYQGDVEDPQGGVRGVIPNKRKYKKKY